jgi:hypothetical protein
MSPHNIAQLIYEGTDRAIGLRTLFSGYSCVALLSFLLYCFVFPSNTFVGGGDGYVDLDDEVVAQSSGEPVPEGDYGTFSEAQDTLKANEAPKSATSEVNEQLGLTSQQRVRPLRRILSMDAVPQMTTPLYR